MKCAGLQEVLFGRHVFPRSREQLAKGGVMTTTTAHDTALGKLLTAEGETVTTVGFEPTPLARPAPKAGALDHSATLSGVSHTYVQKSAMKPENDIE